MILSVSDPKIRLDVFISRECDLSRSNVKTVIEKGGAFVNGVCRIKSGYELRSGDEVEFIQPKPEILEVKAENIPLDIVYEDDWFAVINKPQGMVVHQAGSYKKNDTLVNALLFRLKNLSTINGVIRPGIVHRLDKDTSGLILVAKSDAAHRSLAAQIEKKSAQRIYYGLCDGNFKQDNGTIDLPIARSKKDRKKMAVDENGRKAVTHYTVLERFGKYTLVRFRLETGRTHQIRVHAAFLHHPIAGDAVYGGSCSLYDKGQLLHAKELTIKHPQSGEEMFFECPLPDYFSEILEKLKKSQNK
jgi:23S rRNA pseudouridine1911/1915/1917 synthase